MELEKYSNHLKNIQKLSKTGYIESDLDSKFINFSDSLADILETKTPIKTLEEYNRFIIDANLPAGFTILKADQNHWKIMCEKSPDLIKKCPKSAFLSLPLLKHLEDCVIIPHLQVMGSCIEVFYGNKFFV